MLNVLLLLGGNVFCGEVSVLADKAGDLASVSATLVAAEMSAELFVVVCEVRLLLPLPLSDWEPVQLLSVVTDAAEIEVFVGIRILPPAVEEGPAGRDVPPDAGEDEFACVNPLLPPVAVCRGIDRFRE